MCVLKTNYSSIHGWNINDNDDDDRRVCRIALASNVNVWKNVCSTQIYTRIWRKEKKAKDEYSFVIRAASDIHKWERE